MKKKDYILIIFFALMLIAGIFIKGYFGGFISGAGGVLLITVTVGKILFIKSQKRIDASIALRSRMKD